jgi:hypothetical protein
MHPPKVWTTDYNLFRVLKDHIREHHYENYDVVQEVMHIWLQHDGMDF